MSEIGITKKIDKLGRIVVPKYLRSVFGLTDEVQLQITKEGILLKNPDYVLVKKEGQKVITDDLNSK